MSTTTNEPGPASAPLATAMLGIVLALAVSAVTAAPEQNPGGTPPSTDRLQRLVPDVAIDEPQPTAVDGVFEVRVGGSYVYVTGDGRHAFTGDLLDLSTGQNLTEARRNGDRLAALEDFPDDALLVLPAKGEERHRIHVFTDTTCPYCQKLHQEVPGLREAGVTVAYIPFPRGGPRGPGYRELQSVWCADDPTAAFDIAAGTDDGELVDTNPDCDAARSVDAGFDLGAKLGVQGTPTIVLPSGTALPGYVESAKLLQRLRVDDVASAPGSEATP